jgi:hypothetical protein
MNLRSKQNGVHELKSRQELIAKLTNFDQDEDGNFVLLLTIEDKLLIPRHTISKDHLKRLIGENIGIFRLDEHYYLKKMVEDSDQ